jgi:hypothetical protein
MGTIFVIALEGIANPIPKNVCVPDSIAVSTNSTSLHIVYLLIQVVFVTSYLYEYIKLNE